MKITLLKEIRLYHQVPSTAVVEWGSVRFSVKLLKMNFQVWMTFRKIEIRLTLIQ